MAEVDFAEKLAHKVLDDPSRDPDSDLSVLARQFLRARETIANLKGGMPTAESKR